MLRLSTPSSTRWCNTQGWDFLPLTEPVSSTPFGYSSVSLVAFIQTLKNLYDGYTAILMDADMINVNPQMKVELGENDMIVHGNEYFSSCGFLAVKNSEKVRAFFDKVLSDGKLRETMPDISARLHNNILEQSELKVTHLDDRWNWYDMYFGCAKPVTHPRHEAINVAFHGLSMSKRIAAMQTLAKEIAA